MDTLDLKPEDLEALMREQEAAIANISNAFGDSINDGSISNQSITELQTSESDYLEPQNGDDEETCFEPDEEYQCGYCYKHFDDQQTLELHELIHNSKRLHKCTVCGLEFQLRQHLKVHERDHLGEKPYKCNLCEKIYGRIEVFKNHLFSHRDGFMCKVCDKVFETEDDLQSHEVVAHPKLFKCGSCEKSFTKKRALVDHAQVHSGLKPFKCEYCSKTFRLRWNLTLHERSHTGEKPYVCNFENCSMAFVRRESLKMHKMAHTGQKPFECDVCDKKFSLNWLLKRHRQIHGKD